jgi:hypothetical protein
MNHWKMLRMAVPTAVFLAVALLLVPGAVAADNGGHHGMMGGTKQGESTTQKNMDATCKSIMHEMKSMAKLKDVLSEAKEAAEAKGADKAVAKIDEALKLLEKEHMGMHAMMREHVKEMHPDMMGANAEGKDDVKCPMCGKSMLTPTESDKIVNAYCPITGNKLDPDKVPADLTREWNGQKIGFCCPNCPPAWDKLSDKEKQEKLDAAMAKPSEEKEEQGEHHGG